MPEISTTVAIVLVVAFLVVALAFYLFRGGRLQSFDLQALKGLFSVKGKIDTKGAKPEPEDPDIDPRPALLHGGIESRRANDRCSCRRNSG